MNLFPWIVTLHVLGVVLWMGGLWAASRLMLLQLDSAEPAGRLPEGTMTLFKSVAGHGMMLTVLGGLGLLFMRASYYMHRGWFHMKLTLVVGVVVLHFMLRAQAVKLRDNPSSASRDAVSMISTGLAAAAVLIFILVFFQPF